MKILKSKGPKTELCGTPLYIFFQVLDSQLCRLFDIY